MRIFLTIVVLCLVAASCTGPGGTGRLLGEDQLPSTVLVIDPTRDTTLTTPKGAILKIPKGALDAGGAATVRLEIREAYTIEDIIRGGLLTRSKGQPLSSGGMIYINAAGGQTVTIRRSISVSLPTKQLREGMQRYKGKKDDKGGLDWIDPQPLGDNPALRAIDTGRMLFQSNCAPCHGIGKSVTGPPLGWLPARRDFAWLVSFTRNNLWMQCRNDSLSCYIVNAYNNTPMPLYPNLTDADMDRLYRYIDNESQSVDSSSIPDLRRSFDSCVRYNRLRDSLLEARDSLIRYNKRQVTTNWRDPAGNLLPGSHYAYVKGKPVEPEQHPSVYYEFTIDAFGWYNIDLLLKDLPGFQNSELRVRVRGEYRLEANVFLVIPGYKVFQQGGLLKDKEDEYGFLTDDGKIPLPQGSTAFILVMGEYKGQVFFGKTKWTISLEQHLEVDPSPMTKEQVDEAIGQLSFEKLVITVADSKNAAAIRKADTALQEIERWKPAFCSCVCGEKRFERDTSGLGCPQAPPVPAK